MVEKGYDPKRIEEKWAQYWPTTEMFHAREQAPNNPFSIVIPPPNVTGSLHLGHALNNTLQDILCRYKRMSGFEVLWMPGTDHAGIATQNVVERQLAAQGIKRQDIGREEFLKRVWEWKRHSGGEIISQLKRLGCSCDWKRERFTMDEGLSKTVREVFVRLYHESYIYRGDYMINWCPRCESALADLEVEYPEENEDGFLYQLRYPIEGNPPQSIIVETTRPETMLGDTAVAVHPEDTRYQHLVGKKVLLPLTGRVIPIIQDSFVDPTFGSGAVKITPGHDPNDFEAGKRHQLEIVSVIGPAGKMNAQAGKYAGLDRFECRKQILEDLKKEGVLLEVKKHQLKTGRCYRCQTITEPLVSTQWFMKMNKLAEDAKKAVTSEKTKIVPKNWEATYFQWLDNIRDWCISRQLWWGHQIPVWYCSCGEVICVTEAPKTCPKCKGNELRQDPDVLDTWFSSALWPFSTMGWPEETALLKKFYPTSVLVTGFDILFFWVARMMMLGLKLTQTVPFYDIYLHAMVRDEHGQKMSKTKGNVIDPLVLIEAYGADALRFTLTILALQGRDVNLAESRIEGYRNFINKIWNAVRYTLLQFNEEEPSKLSRNIASTADLSHSVAARWIRSRLARNIQANITAYEKYDFSELASLNYRFFWDEFCAWYVEISKLELKEGDSLEKERILNNLLLMIDASLRLLHPIIPFVTEELFQGLPKINNEARDSLSQSSFPTLSAWHQFLVIDPEAEKQIDLMREVVTAIRTLRAENNIPPGVLLRVLVEGKSEESQHLLNLSALIKGLSRLSALEVGQKPTHALTIVVSSLSLSVVIEEGVDSEKELSRITKELAVIESELERAQAKLSAEEFVKKAPAAVVEKERKKIIELESKKVLLLNHAARLGVKNNCD